MDSWQDLRRDGAELQVSPGRVWEELGNATPDQPLENGDPQTIFSFDLALASLSTNNIFLADFAILKKEKKGGQGLQL